MSSYVAECLDRALRSINALKAKGKEPSNLEISSDVWARIQMGGINMFPDEKIFLGLHVLEREDLKDHIEAV